MAIHVDPTRELDVSPAGHSADESTGAGHINGGPQKLSLRSAVIAGLAVVAVLAAMVGWLGWGAAQQHQGQRHDEVLLAAGRQAAVDLTNVDYTRIDADIERILASATGTFRDDFQKTAADFAGAITQAQSSSVGTVTDVGIESSEGDRARVLVAVSVTTRSAADVGDPEPRGWRMRVTVERAGDETKVADVEFVP